MPSVTKTSRPRRKLEKQLNKTKPAETRMPRLTQLSSCAGCAAKLDQSLLAQVLRQLSGGDEAADDDNQHDHVLVGPHTFDDAGVYQISSTLALVQTVDFFTPIVDDPFDYGQIAATNALSDVYAMGGQPITAMNILGVPIDHVGPGAISEILRGGAAKAREANCVIIGGHTIRVPEPIYGLSVTGAIHPKRILANCNARIGDLLILTKPLGTGIATTAIKRNLASNALTSIVSKTMKQLNIVGAELGQRALLTTATDVTGFGLMGHLGNIVQASGVSAEIHAGNVPLLSPEIPALVEKGCIPGGTQSNLSATLETVDWTETPRNSRILLCDAQTSGGLLLCVPPKNLKPVKTLLRKFKTAAASLIGQIVPGPAGRILVTP